MDNAELAALFEDLTTPHVADACVRTGTTVRCAPFGVQPLDPSHCRMIGRATPARHCGSVDIFLEAIGAARPGDVLVVDNDGRDDEACVGDLITLEAKAAGLAGIVIWGLHRDTAEIYEIQLPLFSLGRFPTGPLRLDARPTDALTATRIGPWVIGTDDVVISDDNGVLFIPLRQAPRLATAARRIRETEIRQAQRLRDGASLREQLHFSQFIARRTSDPALSFRRYLRDIGGAIEE